MVIAGDSRDIINRFNFFIMTEEKFVEAQKLILKINRIKNEKEKSLEHLQFYRGLEFLEYVAYQDIWQFVEQKYNSIIDPLLAKLESL